MRLDSFLSNYFVREVHHFAVMASPPETYRAVCNFDMAKIPWIRSLFRLRTFLDRGSSRFFSLTLRDAYQNGGFVCLQEEPDEELVVGAIGKIWRPSIAFEQVDPRQFKSFHRKGFGKVAWSFRCEPRLCGTGTLGTFEVRVGATDAFSTAKMKAYYSTIGPFSRAIRRSTLGLVTRKLGNAFSDESTCFLPGDTLIEKPVGSFTHAITIEAAPEVIWPWLVQMGCLRAGWYSYDWLDNGGIPSSTRIVPDWQRLKDGDFVPATPQADGGWFVVNMQPEISLVLGGCWDMDSHQTLAPDVEPLPVNYWRSTWAFMLEPQTPTVTRLVVRARGDFREEGTRSLHYRALFIPYIHSFMQREQLRNLKRRAEQSQSELVQKI